MPGVCVWPCLASPIVCASHPHFTSEQVCGVCGVLSRLILTQLALETDRKHGERKRGDFWRGYVPGVSVWPCLAWPIVCTAHPH